MWAFISTTRKQGAEFDIGALPPEQGRSVRHILRKATSMRDRRNDPDPAAALPDRIERSGEPRAEPEVQWNHVVRGFEVEPGKVVTVTSEELGSLAPERTRELVRRRETFAV